MDPTAWLALKLKKTRTAAKAWAKNARKKQAIEEDCRLVIDIMDALEEFRLLTRGERLLRSLVQNKLNSLIQDKASYWWQHGRVRKIHLGIDNVTFRALASQNFR